METATYIGLSYQAGLERKLDVVANNVANLSTPGFKSQQVMFDQYLNNPKGEEKPYVSVNDFGQYMDTSPGTYAQTARPLDVAIEGDGYFGVITGQGVKYTRAGSFSLNSVGEIVTLNGQRVADEGGAPITVPANTNKITIAADGVVYADDNGVGTLLVAEFANPQNMKPIGNSLFDTTEAPLPPTNSQVRQGMLEGSNVNGVSEMANMMEILRNYQSVQRMMQSEGDRMRSSIQRLSGRGN